ncbi:hypothetical protein PR048_030837 [Dryococelus australis]|uniref:Uncharacterized protein n=1 Tax=Dryococelus australis TaxID=614101 RepID=A0ABQ9GA21_9NEOP|nr:hypothetical protein PR048_030837 [Dryococelus australis]
MQRLKLFVTTTSESTYLLYRAALATGPACSRPGVADFSVRSWVPATRLASSSWGCRAPGRRRLLPVVAGEPLLPAVALPPRRHIGCTLPFPHPQTASPTPPSTRKHTRTTTSRVSSGAAHTTRSKTYAHPGRRTAGTRGSNLPPCARPHRSEVGALLKAARARRGGDSSAAWRACAQLPPRRRGGVACPGLARPTERSGVKCALLTAWETRSRSRYRNYTNGWSEKPMSVKRSEQRLNARAGVKREIPEKTRRPTASSSTIPTCENPVTRRGIKTGSYWWEASVLIAQPSRPLLDCKFTYTHIPNLAQHYDLSLKNLNMHCPVRSDVVIKQKIRKVCCNHQIPTNSGSDREFQQLSARVRRTCLVEIRGYLTLWRKSLIPRAPEAQAKKMAALARKKLQPRSPVSALQRSRQQADHPIGDISQSAVSNQIRGQFQELRAANAKLPGKRMNVSNTARAIPSSVFALFLRHRPFFTSHTFPSLSNMPRDRVICTCRGWLQYRVLPSIVCAPRSSSRVSNNTLKSTYVARKTTRLPHLGESGSIPGGVAPAFSHVGIVPYDAAGQRVFSGISRFPRPSIPALLHTHLASALIGSQDLDVGAAVVEPLNWSPPTRANRVKTGPSGLFASGNRI